jgi:hypothetical protein
MEVGIIDNCTALHNLISYLVECHRFNVLKH